MNMNESTPGNVKTIAILGAGGRGQGFARMFNDDPRTRVVAVAEPRPQWRAAFARDYAISAQNTFDDWQSFVQRPRLADAVCIATMDREHVGPAVACMKLGYDVLLEKPMAVTLEDCRLIEAIQRQTGRVLAVCHSLRYQKGFRMVKELLASGAVGRVMTLDLIEQVAWWHQAHSFVRGNFGNSSRSIFMLLAKSCHDIDYLHYIIGKNCLHVSSFGALSYFRPENAPAGAADRCTACPTERECTYSAIRHYVDTDRSNWPASMVSVDHSREAHLQAIATGPYGRCVWKCDNDVVDHQTVNMLFDDQITATFTMTAFTKDGGRRLRVNGTLGELAFDEQSITIKTFADKNVQTIQLGQEHGGHGGGDFRVVCNFIDAICAQDPSRVIASAQESLRTHTVVFAAERSRLEGRSIRLAEMA
jgi:predicted dehydrogenase